MDKIKKLEVANVIKDYNYMQETLENKKELVTIINDNFFKEVSKKGYGDAVRIFIEKNSNKYIDKGNTKNDDKEIPVLPKDLKKIYRKITSRTHPDKLIKMKDELKKFKYLEMYKQAVTAKIENDKGTMLDLALQLNIDLPDTCYEHLSDVRQSIEHLKFNIQNMENTYPWLWHVAPDEAKKTEIIEKYVNSIS